MIYYISVAGTHGENKKIEWHLAISDFSNFLLEHGYEQIETNPLKRYMWSTSLDGFDANNTTWDAAGRALAHYIVPPLLDKSLVRPEDTYIVTHSHGGNVVAYACGKYGLKINGLVTVGMPIRGDMNDIYEAASINITRHLHIYAGWRDYWQVLGALFDGRFGIHRKHPFATRNDKAPGCGHGSILRDKTHFNLWLERGWLDYWQDKKPSQ